MCRILKLDTDEAKAALLNLLRKKSVFHGDFTLSSGAKSNFYIDCRLTTFDPEDTRRIVEAGVPKFGALSHGEPVCVAW